MRVLAVFCHPCRNSFTGALLDAFLAGLADGGHPAELADLYREGFDPSFRPEDYARAHAIGLSFLPQPAERVSTE